MTEQSPAAIEFDPYALPASAVQEPPKSLWAALKMIGPGIVLAGTIVGSGELIATTSLGAKHGFEFLWLILLSCVIKVFVQIELARYAISSGRPTLGALNDLPGPKLGAHWVVWWWLIMMLATIFQLGAMTGAVGQSLHLAFPSISPAISEALSAAIPNLSNVIAGRPAVPWAVLTCLVAMVLLWSGSYRRIEFITTGLVVGITLLTVSATLALPATPFPIHWDQVAEGFKFHVPGEGIAVAFGVFGMTGVGATELFYYPYWCLEKGYARFVGRADGSDAWERRARGWMRVLHLDAWTSMIVFTISTVAFYFMGAAVLHPQGLVPKSEEMIGTLSRMFIDTFGPWTRVVFLVGAGTVLFKTLYLASAGNGRLLADFLNLTGIVSYETPGQRATVIRRVTLLFPMVALILVLVVGEPVTMVVIGGAAQAITLPVIAGATLYFRYYKTDRRMVPPPAWDILLWLASLAITVVALFAVYSQVNKLLGW